MKCILVFAKCESRELKNVKYLSANLMLVVCTLLVSVILPGLLMPPTPQSLVTVVKHDNLLLVGEAFSFDDMGGSFVCINQECRTKSTNQKQLKNYNGVKLKQKDTIFTLTDVSNNPKVSIFSSSVVILVR